MKRSSPSAVVPVVFFGGANAGKSTLIGYIIASLRDDIDTEKRNKEVRELYPSDYRDEQYYAYIVDQAPEEIMNKTTWSRLGTSTVIHISRIPNITVKTANSTEIEVDTVLIDTPGSMKKYRERVKGLAFGEIGIFVFEITRIKKFFETPLSQEKASFNELIEILLPLKAWLQLPSKPATIVVLSKSDFAEDIPIVELTNKWREYAEEYCGTEVNSIPVIPTEVRVKKRSSDNVIDICNYKKYEKCEGPLWRVLKQYIESISKSTFNTIKNETSVLAFDKLFSVSGIGTVLQGKVVSGFFGVGMPVKVIPAHDENQNLISNGLSCSIKSIRQVDRTLVNIAARGDMVGFAFNKFRGALAPINGTLVINQKEKFHQGSCLEIAFINEQVEFDSEKMEPEKKIKILGLCGVVWFGKVLWGSIIAINRQAMIVEAGSGHIFVMPCKQGTSDFLLDDVILIFQNRDLPVKGKLHRLGEISHINVGEVVIEKSTIEPSAIKWADRLKKEGIKGLSESHIEPSNVTWKEV